MQKIVSGYNSVNFDDNVRSWLNEGYIIVPDTFFVTFAPADRSKLGNASSPYVNDYFVCILQKDCKE